MPEVTIYTTTDCGQCFTVKRWFEKKGVPYVDVPADLDTDESRRALATVTDLGYSAAPVIVVREHGEISHHFHGFKPAELEAVRMMRP